MRYHELLDAPTDDLRVYHEATRIRDAFKAFLEKRNQSTPLNDCESRSVRLGNYDAYTFTPRQLGLTGYADLRIGVCWRRDGTLDTAHGHCFSTGDVLDPDGTKTYFVLLSTFAEMVDELDLSNHLHWDSFSHEMTHYFDHKRHDNPIRDLSGRRGEYTNHPMETNARFTQGIDAMTSILDRMSKMSLATQNQFKARFLSNFQSFSQRFGKEFPRSDQLQPTEARQFTRRLYKLWAHIKDRWPETGDLRSLAMAESIQEDVWHGAGAKFDRFSTDFMSTGEGAQVYGWGIYFTDRKEIAQHYQRQVAGSRAGLIYPSGETTSVEAFANQILDSDAWLTGMGYSDVPDYVTSSLREHGGNVAACLAQSIEHASSGSPRSRAFYGAGAEVFQAMADQGLSCGLKGHLYGVRIPDGPYLDWDRPFVAQPRAVSGLVRTHILPALDFEQDEDGVLVIAPGRPGDGFTLWGESREIALRAFFASALLTGEYIYKALSSILGNDKAASLELAKNGIPGLKYLTGVSRNGHGSDYNYVLFEDRHAEITGIHEDVFHGTPYGFDKFSTSSIGTGEGAQVYGWGLYFAGDQEVAEFYRNKLSKDSEDRYNLPMLDEHPINIHKPMNELTPQERAAIAVHDARGYQPAAIRELEEWLEMRKTQSKETETSEAYRMDMETLRVLKSEDFTGRVDTFFGYMYHVMLPDTDDWLLWDEPVDKQPASIGAALQQLGVMANIDPKLEWRERGRSLDYGFENGHNFIKIATIVKYASSYALYSDQGDEPIQHETTSLDECKALAVKHAEWCVRDPGFLSEHHLGDGARAYKVLAQMLGSDKQASIALALQGVAGIKYLDGNSRIGYKDDGDETYNYVLFDDKNASVMKREMIRNFYT